MAKIILIPNKKELDYEVDAYLLGIEDLSVNMPIYFTLEEIKNLNTNKEIFISLNKNMHSSDLKLLEQSLIELSKLNIKGIFFYDIGVLNIVKKLKLNLNLVISQEHMNNNYETINYWHSKGVMYTELPTEISENEIIEITKNTKSKLILPILGYFPMFVSKRHLVTNYLNKFKLKDTSKLNYIEKEGNIYPIVDEKVTTVYTSSYQNGIKEYVKLKNDIEYILINSFLIEDEKLKKIINMMKNVTEESKDEYFKQIDNMLNNNTNTFFFHKQSIYKVK